MPGQLKLKIKYRKSTSNELKRKYTFSFKANIQNKGKFCFKNINNYY